MTLIDLHSYQKVATEPRIFIQQMIQKEKEEKRTSLPKIPSRGNGERFTNKPEEREEKDAVTQTAASIRPSLFTTPFSKTYISYNTETLVRELTKELSAWEEIGTEEGLLHISNIKELLEKYEFYLQQKPENRILASLLQLIFENNSWETLTPKELRLLKNELIRFREGTLDWKRLQTFSKQLYRAGISPLKSGNESS